MSISPPLNQHFQVLLSGIDSLYLAIDIVWSSPTFLAHLEVIKAQAKETGADQPLFPDTDQGVSFMVRPFGSNGYSWLLIGKEYALRIGDWKTPGSRPSVLVEIRSETLWHYSPTEAYQRILTFLENQGARIITIKPSRIDLCLDLLLPQNMWNFSLLDTAITRAKRDCFHRQLKQPTGIAFGKGDISARIYDKALEIQQQSKKLWFFDLWKLTAVPDGFKVIRVEFQLRRRGLKTLGLDTLDSTFPTLENLWAYCSQTWLSFRDHPEREHHRRPVSAWWQVIQNSFLGIEHPAPLVRAKAIYADKIQLSKQAYGVVTSLFSLDLGSPPKEVHCSDLVEAFFENCILAGKTGQDLIEDVVTKRLKLYRGQDKQKEARQLREQNGFPCNLPKEDEP
jgi:hypothetical protein